MIRRNTGVTYAAKAFLHSKILKTTNIFTQERDRTNASFVRLALPVKEIKQCMRKDILVTNGVNQVNQKGNGKRQRIFYDCTFQSFPE
jgi:hypothetical protein